MLVTGIHPPEDRQSLCGRLGGSFSRVDAFADPCVWFYDDRLDRTWVGRQEFRLARGPSLSARRTK